MKSRRSLFKAIAALFVGKGVAAPAVLENSHFNLQTGGPMKVRLPEIGTFGAMSFQNLNANCNLTAEGLVLKPMESACFIRKVAYGEKARWELIEHRKSKDA
jgi:hypothetical protein